MLIYNADKAEGFVIFAWEKQRKEVFNINYPKVLKKLNHALAICSGFIALLVGIMLVVQVILRYIFKSPTSWITDCCAYGVCVMLFIAGGNTYQIHGHVGVDLLRNFIDKKTHKAHNRLPVRILAIIGWLQTLFFLGVMCYVSFVMAQRAAQYHRLTDASLPIPQMWIYVIIGFGLVMMVITVICIFLTLFTKDEEYMKS